MGEKSLSVVLEIGQRVDLDICYFNKPLLKYSNFLFQTDFFSVWKSVFDF